MLFLVGLSFSIIPLKSQFVYTYSVITTYVTIKLNAWKVKSR